MMQAQAERASPIVVTPMPSPVDRAPYCLEEVLSRSNSLRGCSLDEPGDFSACGQRGFLALTGAKMNARVFPGRPLEADYALVLNPSGKPKVLGRGMSGPIHQVRRRGDGRCCAVKSFQKSRLDERQMRMLRNEAQIFLEVDHPNIVRLMGCYEDANELHFVMECCHGGEVYKELIRRRHYNENQTADIVRQMLWALLYLHENSLVHRDLKLENWMFEGDDEYARVKLIDFGLSRVWDAEDVHGHMSRSCGTVNYMAPEVLEGCYGQKADLWSMGVIVFMLLSGKCPFYAHSCDGFTREVIASSIREASFEYCREDWCEVSAEARDFVNRLLVKDPAGRMDAREALAHPWLRQCCGFFGEVQGKCKSRQMAQVDSKMLDSWRRFAQLSPTMRVMLVELAFSSRWPEGSMAGLQELFAEHTQHRGTMQLQDFSSLIAEAGQDVSLMEASHLFESMACCRGRVKHDGTPLQIAYSEFLAAALPGRFSHDELLAELFRMVDLDRDGMVSNEEFMAVLAGTAVSQAEVKEYMRFVDLDGDGAIRMQDFARALASSARSPDTARGKFIHSNM